MAEILIYFDKERKYIREGINEGKIKHLPILFVPTNTCLR
jgi:hypothetical protein